MIFNGRNRLPFLLSRADVRPQPVHRPAAHALQSVELFKLAQVLRGSETVTFRQLGMNKLTLVLSSITRSLRQVKIIRQTVAIRQVRKPE